YFESPTVLQFLHCLKNSVKGGSSLFADSFTAVQRFKSAYPADFLLLTQTPLTFHYINDGHHMHYNRPIIAMDQFNDEFYVNYAPPFQGPIESLLPQHPLLYNEENDIKIFEFYKAYKRFSSFIEDDDLKFKVTLKPGELAIFANRRVLHGRTSFDQQSAERHLKGAYLDFCALKDKFRILKAKQTILSGVYSKLEIYIYA
ncbi:2957_t:CDS:1, partial [Gigaspora rosea]